MDQIWVKIRVSQNAVDFLLDQQYARLRMILHGRHHMREIFWNKSGVQPDREITFQGMESLADQNGIGCNIWLVISIPCCKNSSQVSQWYQSIAIWVSRRLPTVAYVIPGLAGRTLPWTEGSFRTWHLWCTYSRWRETPTRVIWHLVKYHSTIHWLSPLCKAWWHFQEDIPTWTAC